MPLLSFPKAGRAMLFAPLVLLGTAPGSAQPAPGGPPLACLTAPAARALLIDNKLVPPIRVMRQAAQAAQAQAIDIQLCRFNGQLVYDVTLLNGEGRVMHRLIAAADGTPVEGHPALPPVQLGPPVGRPVAPEFLGPPLPARPAMRPFFFRRPGWW